MQDRVEPPILLSRLLTFTFVAMLVVLCALVVTLYNMYPLNRPQVFFLTTSPKSDLQILLYEMVPNDENLNRYKRAFIREYLKARNEIVPNANVMRTKWNNGIDGVVYEWSSQDVYNEFTKTNMWNAWMSGLPDFEFSCSVEFGNNAFEPYSENVYLVNFYYFCSDSDRQMDKKEYKIRIKLDVDDSATIKWSDRINNPLGIRVSEYEIESGNGDPLNTGYLETTTE